MRHAKLRADQVAATGFTDLFVVGVSVPGLAPASTTAPNDFSQGFSNKQIALDALDVGDFVGMNTLVEIKTAFAGPTASPTISVGINGAVTQFTATQVVLGAPVVYQAAGAAVAGYAVTAAKTLQVDCQAGGGDAAVPTAGEVWIWMNISRINERSGVVQA